jgi:hypothetical protein
LPPEKFKNSESCDTSADLGVGVSTYLAVYDLGIEMSTETIT